MQQQNKTQNTLYVSDLLECKIVDANGKLIGHVADIQLTPAPEYRICAFFFGPRGWLHRLHVLNPFEKRQTSPAKPDKIPWEAIERIDPPIITLKSGIER